MQMSVKLTKEVFLVPTRTTWGGFITNFLFSPATISGFFSLMMLKTLFRSWNRDDVLFFVYVHKVFNTEYKRTEIESPVGSAEDKKKIKIKIKKESSV